MIDKKSKSEKNPYQITHFEIWERVVIGILLFFMILSPIIFTRSSFSGIFFNNTGEIGDTIGGLTAPFVNLLAAFLVYKSFVAQIKANLDQRRNHDSQMKLIRKEQSLNTLIYLFNEIENTVIESDKNIHNGSIRAIITLNSAHDDQMSRHQNNHEYAKKLNADYNRTIGVPINVLYNNIRHLLRLIRHLESYMDNYSDEKNAADFTGFFVSKVYDIVNKLKYRKILEDELKEIMTRSHLDENNILRLNNAKLRFEDLQSKLQSLLVLTGLF